MNLSSETTLDYIKLTTINMEGKGNSLYLNTLESTSDVICIQEHWQYEFQKDSLASILPNMDMHIICSDTFEEISNFNLPRGKGGIAVAWKRELSTSLFLDYSQNITLTSFLLLIFSAGLREPKLYLLPLNYQHK